MTSGNWAGPTVAEIPWVTDRRMLIASLAASLVRPLAVHAQTSARTPRVGILFDGLPLTPEQLARSPLAQGLRELGWVPGETIVLERVYSEGRPERLAELATELVRRRVDIIWCNAPPPTIAAARATKTIPIVFWGVAQPVAHGLIESFRRPGRNVTGFAFSPGPEIVTKQAEFLKAIAPGTRRVARLGGVTSVEHLDGHRTSLPVIDAAFQPFGIEERRFPIASRGDVPGILTSIRDWRADAIFAFGDPATMNERHALADFAYRHRLVSGFGMKEYVLVGGLFSYGPDTADTVRRSAAYIDRILKGANPAELPVEQPSTFHLVINVKIARAIGLTVPQALLFRADQIIE
jgi:putative ABC transport system substrate-binding protein